MKIQKLLLASLCFTMSSLALAHCPSAYKEEKVCFMFEDNMLYIYDHKLEHNGPYKDLSKAMITGLKKPLGPKLDYKKIARGIYKIETTERPKSIVVEILLDKKKTEIEVTHE